MATAEQLFEMMLKGQASKLKAAAIPMISGGNEEEIRTWNAFAAKWQQYTKDNKSAVDAGEISYFIDLEGLKLRGVPGQTLPNLTQVRVDPRNGATAVLGDDLRDLTAHSSWFMRVNARNANLTGAKLQYSDLGGADFTGAKLIGADLTGLLNKQDRNNQTIISGADLSGAKLNGADLTGFFWDDKTNFKGATYDAKTQFPRGLKEAIDKANGRRAELDGADSMKAALEQAQEALANPEVGTSVPMASGHPMAALAAGNPARSA